MLKHLTPSERNTLQMWFKTNTTLFDVERLVHTGAVGNQRFTARCVRVFKLLWAWSDQRFFGAEGEAQQRCFDRNGSAFLERRIARCNKIIQDLLV